MTTIRKRRQEQSVRNVTCPTVQKEAKSGSLCLPMLTSSLICISLVTTIIAYAYVSSPITSVTIEDSHDADSLKWSRVKNYNLQQGIKIFTDMLGPESIAVDDQQNCYTGLVDGRLIKISNFGKPIEKVLDITKDVDYTANGGRSRKRPLGMRIVEGELYFADSYQGIFVMNLTSLSWRKLLGFNEVTPYLKFANDLTISLKGVIYFIDSCARRTYDLSPYSVAEGMCTGRLFKIFIDGTGVQLLQDNLCFPNGIELVRDETRVLVSENGRQRIAVINVQSGKTEKIIHLHGGADNIRRSLNGGYWVPIPMLRRRVDSILDRYPFIRDVAITFFGVNSLDKFAHIYQGTIVKLNEELEIDQIHQDPKGKVAWAISEVQEYQPGKLLLGSFVAPGLVKLNMQSVYGKAKLMR